MDERSFEFEWDPAKATANERKHAVLFELASTIFHDPNLLTVADLEHGEIEQRWLSIGIASNGAPLAVAYLWLDAEPAAIRIRLISARKATRAEVQQYRKKLMNDQELDENNMPAEINFRDATRGLHHIPPDAKVLMPVSIDKTVWEYFSGKAEQRGLPLSDLLTEVLKRDIQINEALK